MIAPVLVFITQDLRKLLQATPAALIRDLWIVFGVYWLVSAFQRKKTKKRESWLQHLRCMLPLVVACYLLSQPEAHHGWLGARFVPDTLAVAWTGVFLTAAGAAVAFWARYHLGANWSGVVTLKEDHELIRTGPYRAVRHPIYTGILLAIFGTVIAHGEVRGPIALALTWLSFYIKARREESFLAQEFGPRFTEHSQLTGMFLPRFSS